LFSPLKRDQKRTLAQAVKRYGEIVGLPAALL